MSSRPPLWKQLLGAVIGSALALTIYWSVNVASPRLTAYVTLPETQVASEKDPARIADRALSHEKRTRIQSRTREIAKEFASHRSREPREMLMGSAPDTRSKKEMKSKQQEKSEERREKRKEKRVEKPAEEVEHMGAPVLPDSGLGLWFAILVTLLISLVIRFRNKQILSTKL